MTSPPDGVATQDQTLLLTVDFMNLTEPSIDASSPPRDDRKTRRETFHGLRPSSCPTLL